MGTPILNAGNAPGSVWVAIFRENDVHHVASVAFLDLAVANQGDINIPNLALAEIAGVFARQTGQARLAIRTVTGRIRFHATCSSYQAALSFPYALTVAY